MCCYDEQALIIDIRGEREGTLRDCDDIMVTMRAKPEWSVMTADMCLALYKLFLSWMVYI